MAEEKIENKQEIVQEEVLSILDQKRKVLLDEVSDLMEKIGEDLGPVFQKELQRRMEFVVQNFNEEVKGLFLESFDRWQVKDSQLRDLMDGSRQLPQSQSIKSNAGDSTSPEFIKDVKFGPVRP